MHYFTIDFETANSHRGSVCAIGIVEVLDSKIINTFRSLINPEESFDFYNTLIHFQLSHMLYKIHRFCHYVLLHLKMNPFV